MSNLPRILTLLVIIVLSITIPGSAHAFSFTMPTIPPIPTIPDIQSRIRETSSETIIKRVTVTSDGTTTVEVTSPPTVTATKSPTPTVARLSSTNTIPLTKTPTPTIRLIKATPTKILPTNTPQPTSRPTTTATPNAGANTDSVQAYIMQGINDYRKSKGLSTVKISSETCSFAKIRAKEISVSFNHDGFRSRINNGTLPYSSWSSVTENLAMTSNYKNVVTMWINSPGHAANMQKNTPYVCVEQYGNYFAYEGMRP